MPKEVMIVDGDSTDDTYKIAEKYKINFFRKKGGLGVQRNYGIKKAKYHMVAFLDSDCKANREWLGILYSVIRKNKRLMAVGGRLIEKNTKGIANKWRVAHMSQGWGNTRLENPDFLFGSNFLIKKEIAREMGYFNEQYKTNFEDVDLFRRIKKERYSIAYIPDAFCYHMKKDNILSVMKTNYRWQYYAYPLPINLLKLLFRLVIFNPHKTLKYAFRDVAKFRFELLPMDALMYICHCYYDILDYIQ